MTLQFIIGSAGQDHFKTTVDQLKRQFKARPKERFFYLIPNHIKFDAEVQTLQQLNQNDDSLYAQTNIQILSLTRLAWFLFGQDPEYQVPRLSDAGINMLLYQILLDYQSELRVFRGEEGHPGFISQLGDQINELQVGQISPDDLQNLLNHNEQLNRNLRAKLSDLVIIYRAFVQRTNGKYLHKADFLKLFAKKLQDVDLSQTHFFISGFSQMTAQELAIVNVMIQKSASVTVDIILDRPAPNQLPDEPNLFAQPARLYHQLYQIARQNGVHVQADLYASSQRVSADLDALDHFWITSNQLNHPMPPVKLANVNSLQVIRADNPYSEVAKVALMIRKMVASGHYRYRDFIVMTRHLDQFNNMIRPIFKMQSIPYFEDVQRTMDTHPLVELINALFTIQAPNQKRSYRYADVMRLLKTELLLPKDDQGSYISLDQYRNDLALAENLVLRNGYDGSRWTQKQDWNYVRINTTDFNLKAQPDPVITKQVNRIRHFVKAILPPFYRQMNKVTTGKEAAKVLYHFLVQNGVVDQLKRWRDQATQADNLNEAGQPEQVWTTFCDLLDDYVDILGDHEFRLADFLNLLQAGFEGANYSQIPSTLDQVAISESGIVQTHSYRVVFMIGSTDETMPDQVINDSLLSDGDRDEMEKSFDDGQFLPDTSETKMANAPFLNYEAFMSGSQNLIFTYSLNDANNQESGVKRSPYVDRIMNHFSISEQIFHAMPKAQQKNILDYVGTKRTTLRHLVQASYQSKNDHLPLSNSWRFIYEQLIQTSDVYRDLTNKLLGGLNYQNRPQPLKKEIATDLYSKVLNTSISQLEDFYKNPYEYFLTYGLSLKPREEFELSSGNKGQFFHSVLEQMISQLNQNGLNLATVDENELAKLVGRIGNQMIQNDPRYQILTSTNQMKYISSLLIKTVKRMALTMHWQSHFTPMRPHQTEVSFGQSGKVDNFRPLLFDVDKDRKLRVRGRIDRIDDLTTANKRFLAIVDYKSGNKTIQYDELYSGISIQLMTYLDVIKNNLDHYNKENKEKLAELAGALYLHVQDPILSTGDLKKQSFEKAMLKAQRYNGLIVDDPDLLNLIKKDDLDQNKRSLIYKGLATNAKQEITGRNVLVSNDQLKTLLDYTEQLIRDAGQRIFSGDIAIAPVKTNSFDAMQYTDYAAIMQFDPLLNENNYRQIDKMQLKDLLDEIKRRGQSNEIH